MNQDSPKRIAGIIPLLILITGVFFLAHAYSTNTSFWKDEVFLALNFLERDGPTIELPLDHSQVAPLGFLQINRTLESILGHSEHTFWLLSLASSVALLVGSYFFYRKALPKLAGTIALALLAFNGSVIIYATQFKPYLLDALCTMGLMALFWSIPKQELKPRHYLGWIAAGLLSLWLSFTAVFVIAGLGAWLIGEAWAHKRPRVAWSWVGTNAILATAFVGLWLACYQNLDSDKVFYNFWLHDGGFVPWNISAIAWIGIALQASMSFLFASVPGILILLLMAVGIPYAWKLNKRTIAWLIPAGLTFVAAAAHIYPIHSRLVMFWLPLVLPFVALGIYRLWEVFRHEHRGLGITLMILLVIPFAGKALTKFDEGNFQDIRGVAAGISQQAKAGDIIWIHPRALDLYTYYFVRYPLAEGVETVSCTEDEAWGAYAKIKKEYARRRVFVAATEAYYNLSEIDLMEMSAKADGTLKTQIDAPLAKGMLLEF